MVFMSMGILRRAATLAPTVAWGAWLAWKDETLSPTATWGMKLHALSRPTALAWRHVQYDHMLGQLSTSLWARACFGRKVIDAGQPIGVGANRRNCNLGEQSPPK